MDIERAKSIVGNELRIYGEISEKVNRCIGKFYGRQIKKDRIFAKIVGNHGEYTVSVKLDGQRVSFNKLACLWMIENANKLKKTTKKSAKTK